MECLLIIEFYFFLIRRLRNVTHEGYVTKGVIGLDKTNLFDVLEFSMEVGIIDGSWYYRWKSEVWLENYFFYF